MKITPTAIPEVIILDPIIYEDSRGYFFESYNERDFAHTLGFQERFVQDNHSFSVKDVLRGLHYQTKVPQGKLIRVVEGDVYDVIVDVRGQSATFGRWVGIHLSSKKPQLVWVPRGFAHGFLTLSEHAHFVYKTTDYYDKESEECIRWDDPDLSIAWPIQMPPILSDKDRHGKFLKDATIY